MRSSRNAGSGRSLVWIVPLLTSMVLGSFGGRASAAVRMPTHVACVGDSITEGFGTMNAATQSYPAQLQGLFGAQVMVKNFGRSGTTMLSQGFGDNPYENTGDYPNAQNFVKGAGANAVIDVIIMLGTNDSKPQNWTPAGKPKNDQQFLKDYRAMVEKFLSFTPKPVVFLALPTATNGNNPCCMISGTVIHDEEIPLIKQLAAEKSLPIIDLNTPTTGHPEYFGDGVHPTVAGYVVVAKLMHDGLLQDLAPVGADAGADGATDGSDAGRDGGAADAAGAGTGGNAGTGGAGSMTGTDGAGGATANEDAGRPDVSSADSGQGGSGGSSSGSSSNGATGGCSVAGRGERGALSSLVALSVLLSLMGWRRRSGRRVRSS